MMSSPVPEFGDVEKAILGRLAVAGDRTAYDVANDTLPVLEEMEAWFAMLQLEKTGLICRDVTGAHLWRLTDAGKIAVREPESEFKPVPGYEGLYELSRDGRLFAVERTMVQEDTLGRKFEKTIKRHEKAMTVNGRGYPAFNLNKDNKQTCRLVVVLMRATWGPSDPGQGSP